MKRLMAFSFALGLALTPASFGAASAAEVPTGAAQGGPEPTQNAAGAPDRVSDRELVVVYMDADGTIARTSLVDSLTTFGQGAVTVTDVGEPAGFRNLNGFTRPAFDGNNLTWRIEVEKRKDLLTASTVEGALPAGPPPVAVTPRYFLNGEAVNPERLRGAEGDVAVEFALENQTAQTQTLSFYNNRGSKVSGPLETYVPFVAQVTMDLPSSQWTRISAPGGRIITDDNGVHHIAFSPILAPLLGSVRQTVRLEGAVKDLELGTTRIVALPLAPPDTSLSTASQTTGGAFELYGGVGQVDSNLQQLSEGTIKLIDGLAQLEAGIVEAHQGSIDLADGLTQIRQGTEDATDGADQLEAGAGAVGVGDTIVDGLKQVLDGLEALGDETEGLPAAKAGVDALIAGVEAIVAGIGDTATGGTILGGLDDVRDGIAAASAGLDGIVALIGESPDPIVIDELADLFTTPPPGAATSIRYDVEYLRAYAQLIGALCGAGCAGLTGTIDDVADDSIQTKLAGASAGITGGVQPGLDALVAGVETLIDGMEDIKVGLESADPSDPGVLEGLQAVSAGLAEAIAGIGTVGEEDTLTDGVNQLFVGAEDLADGIQQLADGLAELTTGTSDAETGAGDLADGLGQIETGATDAKDGASQIGDGQNRLSREGTQVIQKGVGTSLKEASQALAVLEAMKVRANDDAFLYGPPQGGTGSAAYVYEIRGIDARNFGSLIKFGVAAAMMAGLGFVGAAVRARRAA